MESKEIPGEGYTGRTGPSGATGDKRHGHDHGQQRPRQDRCDDPDEDVEDGVGRTRAQRAQDPEVPASARNRRATTWVAIEERGQQGHATEDAEGDGDRLESARRLSPPPGPPSAR